MALSYVFRTLPLATAIGSPSGTVYTANAQGIITGVAGVDAITPLQSPDGPCVLMAATGATTDRPKTAPGTALTGALNDLYPAPTLGLPFWDTTLTKMAFYTGANSSTGWVDYTGAVV